MNAPKLTDILTQNGLLTDDQVRKALDRQRARGGRIGAHLLYYRFVTEEQLASALSEQYNTPWVCLDGMRIAEEVTRRLPVEIADEYQILPFKFDVDTQTLHVAIADPGDTSAMYHARRAAQCNKIEAYVAVDVIVRNLIAEHYHGQGRELFLDQIIELPALFADEAGATSRSRAGGAADPARDGAPRVLMVSRAVFLKNFLVSIFEREGFDLEVLGDPQEIAARLRSAPPQHVLVAKDMEEQFAAWARSGVLAPPRAEMSVFSSVSGALLDNPAPYRAVVGSLIRALQQMADLRCVASAYKPPYGYICEDLRTLAGALGLRRLAVDGLQLTAHLLVPGPDPAAGPFAFVDFQRSVETAQALRFPWDVEACLVSFAHGLGDRDGRNTGHRMSLAAQILAVVWYRFAAFRGREVGLEAIKAELRQQGGRIAAAEVVEAYVRVLDQGSESAGGNQEQVLIVSDRNETAQQLGVHLRYGGYRVVEVEDIDEARRLVSKLVPAVVLIDHGKHGPRAIELCKFVKNGAPALVYAFSAQANGALVMELLDAGFDDAFGPPFNYNLVVTRIGKAIEMRGSGASGRVAHGFRGTLAELPFVDLVQAMAGSQRSVHLQLQSGSGERAAVYIRNGRIVHAVCGPEQGAAAVYRVIAWRDEGSFTTGPVATFPPDNVSEPTDLLLFEGCRLLDEGR